MGSILPPTIIDDLPSFLYYKHWWIHQIFGSRKELFQNLFHIVCAMSKQSHIESTVEEDKATKYDLPSIPMKLVNTTTFSKKQKEKLRKKQEKLDRVLETLGVEEYEFLETFRDKPLELRGLLDRALMKRMTFLSAGGELGGTDEVKAEVLEELEELEDELKGGKGKKKKKGKRFQKPTVEEKEPLVINRKTIHDAYYFLKETYVDKLEKKAEEGLDVEKGYLKAKSPSMQK